MLKRKRVKCLIVSSLILFMYPDPGSNRDGLLHWCLRPARLPIPPSGRGVYVKTGAKIHIFSKSHKFLKENHAVKD